MTAQASVIINFHDDPEKCQNAFEDCHHLFKGHCVLRIVDHKSLNIDKYLALKQRPVQFPGFYLKDPSCKFIWEKSKRGV